MKGHHVNITKRGLSRGRSPVAGNKRNTKLQWNAAKHFYQWGDVSPDTHVDLVFPAFLIIHSWIDLCLTIFILLKAIGTRLSEICHSDSESPANIMGFIYDEETKRRARKEDEEEDYLDDSKSWHNRWTPKLHVKNFHDFSDVLTDTVNPTKCGCPFALKMAACQLLLEITTFLRETFPCLPRPRTEPLVVSISTAPFSRPLR